MKDWINREGLEIMVPPEKCGANMPFTGWQYVYRDHDGRFVSCKVHEDGRFIGQGTESKHDLIEPVKYIRVEHRLDEDTYLWFRFPAGDPESIEFEKCALREIHAN